MKKTYGPKNVVIFSYKRLNWLYIAIIPYFKQHYNSRFVVIGSNSSLNSFKKVLDDTVDIFLDVEKLNPKLKEGFSEDIVSEQEIARVKEKLYNMTYMKDIIQQDREISTYFLSNAEKFIWTKIGHANNDFLIKFVNGCVKFSEELLLKERIDLALVWPLDCLSAAMSNVFEKNNILVTYPYVAKYKNYGFWVSSAFQDDSIHKEFYTKSNFNEVVDKKDIIPPNTGWPATSEMNKIYSFKAMFFKITKNLFFRIEFLVRDLIKLDFKRKNRINFLASLLFSLNSWWIYKKISKNSEIKLSSFENKPFLFYAISLEPEFSVQARCKEFNDQKAIIKQLALSLPAGYEIVIKEHFDIGRRSWSFYRDLIKFPNIRMAHPSIRGIDLVSESRAVATMAGTVALEASMLGKQVVQFSQHSSFSFLPHINTIKDFNSLPMILEKVMKKIDKSEIEQIQIRGGKLRDAIINMSFDAPDTPLFYSENKKPKLSNENFDKAINSLLYLYNKNNIKI